MRRSLRSTTNRSTRRGRIKPWFIPRSWNERRGKIHRARRPDQSPCTKESRPMLPPRPKLKLKLKIALIHLLWRIGWPHPIAYVGSSEVLPPPLTRDEESSLLERLEM